MLLETITQLSHAFGGADYVKAGGGNTSCKNGTRLWIKPSGTTLAGLAPTRFVALDRGVLERLYVEVPPPDPTERERWVQSVMAAAVQPATPGRASVEAPLHDSFEATFVVHTHPTLVNGLTCALGGAAAAATLFPDALWVPYTDPGYTLCLGVRAALAARRQCEGCEPQVVLLENHGIFVAGDTPEAITQASAAVIDALTGAYASAGVPTSLELGPMPTADVREQVRALAAAALGPDGAAVAAAGPVCPAGGPVSPDHIVYAKSFVYEGVLNATALQAFARRRGYAPRLIATGGGLFGIGPNQKAAELALELGLDGALVRQLARAFGGIQYLSDAARVFIENWEVESYRSRQV